MVGGIGMAPPERRIAPTSASCCAQYAIVEYWRWHVLGQQSEFTPLVGDDATLR
jgi:hypothetical protein